MRKWRLSRVSACRRELNSHEAAMPPKKMPLHQQVAAETLEVREPAGRRSEFLGSTAANRDDLQQSNQAGQLHCESDKGFQSVGGAAKLG